MALFLKVPQGIKDTQLAYNQRTIFFTAYRAVWLDTPKPQSCFEPSFYGESLLRPFHTALGPSLVSVFAYSSIVFSFVSIFAILP